ncbi:urea ABC transporter, permease protein UrtC [Meiothermus luteus]|uniref:Urea ABC transporter, permease protein UrtC n=1 Tax=Meiothermus luteus TaxID=2026184 RepID=A0A399EK39_9DEIN|nr:branched-chain amino acid ABC transporter permease [Meiothermus luteus]RIH85084.1 urea ABC transporter, permease protein UrtC [Meiothermus luteus]RMH55180.1 MAG: branched-chain amino acid ABC transporter permease [Deinococcota bacterium]
MIAAAILLLALLLPSLPLGEWRAFLLDTAQFAFLTSALALAWDLLARSGQLSLAHGAFFGLGAYAAALSAPALGTLPALLAGGLVAALASFLLGLATLRLHGMYFAIATLAFSEVMRTLVLKAQFTGGSIGLPVQPAFSGAFPLGSYYLAVAVLALSAGVSLLLSRGRWHYAMAATRQGEAVARVLGVPVVRVKLLTFGLSAFLGGLVGGVYAMKTLFLSPYDAFGLGRAVEALVVPIFGGLYTTSGPLLGGLIIVGLETWLRLRIGEGYLVIYGLVLILAILFLPRGLVGLFRKGVGRA